METKVNSKKKMNDVFKQTHGLLKISRKVVKSVTEVKSRKDAQVKGDGTGSIMKTHWNIARQGIERLSGSGRKNSKQEISEKEKMQTIIHSTSDQRQPTLNHFPKTNKVPQINHNNVGTRETILQVQELHQLINRLKDLLEQDKQNILGPADNLLFIHSQLSELKLSRDYTMRQANLASRDIIDTLGIYFQPLNELSEDFTSYLWQLTKNIIPLAENGQASTAIVRLIMVIECEEIVDANSSFGEKVIIKSCKEQFLIRLQNAITEMFEVILNKVKGSPLQLIDELEFVHRDLKLVKEHIAPQFPAHYNITCFFVLAYHKGVHPWLNGVLQSELDAGSKLRLVRWVRRYHSIVVNEMQISKDLLEPQLLDGREQGLVDDYLSFMREKFQEWKSNLMESVVKEFTQRTKEPDMNVDRLLGLPGSPILLSMINQQIDVAIESTHEKILTEVIVECCRVIRDVQETWSRTLKSEHLSFLESKEGFPDGLLEYTVALANDQLHLVDFTNALKERLTPTLSGEHRDKTGEYLTRVTDGCIHLATDAIDTILCIVFSDVKKPFLELHTLTWYKEDHMGVIIITLKDYTDEFQVHLKPYLFDELMLLMTQRFVVSYIESMKNKGSRYRMPYCLDRMSQDVLVAHEYFGKYLRSDELEKQFDPIRKLHNFLGTTQEMIYLDYHALKKSYGDVPRKFLKIILSRRDDLDVFQLKKICKIIKAKELDAGEYAGEPTVFSKIEVEYENFTSEQIKNEMNTFKDEVKQLKHDLREAFGKMKPKNRH